MTSILFFVFALVIIAAVTVIVLLDGPKQKRRDDRDAAKTDEIEANPARLYKSQQAAELQVDEDQEARQPSRFAPDAKANPRYPKGQLQS